MRQFLVFREAEAPAWIGRLVAARRGAIRGLEEGRAGRPDPGAAAAYPGAGRDPTETAQARRGYELGRRWAAAEAAPQGLGRVRTLAALWIAARRAGIRLPEIASGLYRGAE